MKTAGILLTLVFFHTQFFGQKLKNEDLPAPVRSAFEKKYPELKKVEWEKEDGNFEAEFKVKGKEVAVVFDGGGQWLQTETELEKADLPQHVLQFLEKDYPGFKLEEACLIKTSANESYYELEVEKGKSEFEITLSDKGAVLKKEEEKEDKVGKDD